MQVQTAAKCSHLIRPAKYCFKMLRKQTLFLCLNFLFLAVVHGQSNTVEARVGISPSPTTSSRTIISPTMATTSPASPLIATASPSPPSCPESQATVIVALAAVMALSLLFTVIMMFIVCCLCVRYHRRNTEIKQYVFEEGVRHPELWLDPGSESKPMESDPDIFEVTTFSPSPHTKSAPVALPNGTANGTNNPIPVPPVHLKTRSLIRFKPKRTAPPPPKGGRRRRIRRSQSVDDNVVYAIPSPSPYLTPMTSTNGKTADGGYDVPKSKKRGIFSHIYKPINVATLEKPGQYADLVVVKSDNK